MKDLALGGICIIFEIFYRWSANESRLWEYRREHKYIIIEPPRDVDTIVDATDIRPLVSFIPE
jgi:hypothetical protein